MSLPPSSNSIPKSKAEMLEDKRREQLTLMATQQMQLSRTIWMMAKQAGGTMTVDEAEMDPLWDLKYERLEGSQTKLKVIAASLPIPTGQQIEMLSSKLIGTGKNPKEEAINVGLVDYPLSYLVGRLAPHIVWGNFTWMGRAEYDAANKP